ncbi:MAG: JAB domain-containing protein, partial [Caldilineaceae bacterium]|nr:JAB domain-containing protein [Caldilineaceae bacterium]
EQKYQLYFDFDRKAEIATVQYTLSPEGQGWQTEEQSVGRFTRVIKDGVIVRAPIDAARHLLTNVYTPFETVDQEEMWALLMNRKQRITHDVMIYRGTVDIIYIRTAELFKEAVRVNAPAIVLSHCHPSGEPYPSREDVRTTELAIGAGKLLGIDLLDHIVVGDNAWISMREEGLAF